MTQPQNPSAPNVEIRVEDDRTGMHPITLERAVFDHLRYTVAKDERDATLRDIFFAIGHAVRDRLSHRWIESQRAYHKHDVKHVCYLSAEFLLGRALAQNLINLGLFDMARDLLSKHDISLSDVLEQELDPGLGNGGLGRLAACFMDSMACLEIPAYGYGIRYEFGIFDQEIRDGWQIERGDAWLRFGNVWEIPRHEYTVTVQFYGKVQQTVDERGNFRVYWVDTQQVLGVPYDMPIAGYDNNTVNTLRLWSARATKEFNFNVFNDGDYRRAVEEKSVTETISKVLYPNDQSLKGKELRLKQQYFFVCCSIHDIMRRFKQHHGTHFDAFPDHAAIQLNDTHPAIAVAELMRVLIDQEMVAWDRAWAITQRTIAFTNHTLLPEALERWPVSMFGKLLPRHLQIIFEINHRFLRQVHIFAPNDAERQRRMSIIEEGQEQSIRMAHLAVVGSHSVNGVAELHSQLVTEQLLPDFAQLWPERFNNKTNGVSPRRWLLQCNPKLADLLTARLGSRRWITHLDDLARLDAPTSSLDPALLSSLQDIKRQNKLALARYVQRTLGIELNPNSIFDSLVKRIHEYKRQLMDCLHIIHLYRQLKLDPTAAIVPRTFIFGGKAAPGYAAAKLHIKLINDVAAIINNDPAIGDRLRVVFLPNYSVSLAELIMPATDLSEQISLAGKEASGTGNMKFAMNGALTIGTLDGANIEIRDAVGPENFFLFGLNVEQVKALRANNYNPQPFIERSHQLRAVIDMLASGFFSPDDASRFLPIVNDLRHRDTYMICADFDDYVACQHAASQVFLDPTEWTRRVVHNIAHMGKFSSDRTILEYNKDIWHASTVSVSLPPPVTPL
jgi:glycogen phosphorylase